MPAQLVERLVEAMERIATGQTVEAAAEFRTALLTDLNEYNARLQTEALATIAERLGGLHQPPQPSGPGADLLLEQQQAVLKYNAFRTALGRPGAASLVMGVKRDDRITITAPNQLPDVPMTVVVYDVKGNEIGRGHLSRDKDEPRHATIRGLDEAADVARFELWDQSGKPIRFGVLTPILGALTAFR
jgi:hypothetical protein